MLFTDLNASRARAPGDAKSGDLGGFGGSGGKDCVLERHEYGPFGSGPQGVLLERERAASIQQRECCFWFRTHRERRTWVTRNQAIYGVVVDLAARIVFSSATSIVRSDLDPKGCLWSENGPLQSNNTNGVSHFESIASEVLG